MNNRPAIIILAAGGSKRLGQAKQLLPYQNTSLLRRTVGCAVAVGDAAIFVVTGAEKDRMKAAVADADVILIGNDRWEEGLGTSIKAGLSAALQMDAELSGCIFAVCDQPHLNAALLQKMISMHLETGKGIVAASYGDTVGTPVFFARKYFDELLQLSHEEGAKKIVRRHPSDVATVAFEHGDVDIDTMEDYKRLRDAEG